jgi:hypothetical protein
VEVSGKFGLERFDMEEFALLRPDMPFWVKEEKDGIELRKLILVEISVPFGRRGKSDDYDTLEEVRIMKQRKYNGFVNFLKDKLKVQEERGFKNEEVLKLIIISSLGAVPKRTLSDLKDVLGRGVSKSKIELWGKRLCIAAIRGSFCVRMKATDAVYNLMKENRDRLHDSSQDNLKEKVEDILFDLGNRS